MTFSLHFSLVARMIFKEQCPYLYELSTKKVHVVNQKNSHVRFDQKADQELVALVESFKGNCAKKMAIEYIKENCGKIFAKKCRDRYNIYLENQSKFTNEDDRNIIYYRKLGMSWHIIANKLKRNYGNTIKNRYNKLMSKKYAAKNTSNQGETIIHSSPVVSSEYTNKMLSLYDEDDCSIFGEFDAFMN